MEHITEREMQPKETFKMKNTFNILGVTCGLLALSGALHAQTFSAGMPLGWTGVGAYATSAADGVVTLAPTGGLQYGYVSTLDGVLGASPFDFGEEQTGSFLRSNRFLATTGSALKFSFNYVSSDGYGYADYAWARLLNADLSEAAVLFTARTTPNGEIVPGFDMPTPNASIGTYTFFSGAGNSVWSPLGPSSGTCYGGGCGFSGWVSSDFTIASTGSYVLEFGVVNWGDSKYQSGLAFDGITVGGKPVTAVPEPESLALMLVGLVAIGFTVRRHKPNVRLVA